VFVEFVGAACLLIRASISVEIVEPWVASYWGFISLLYEWLVSAVISIATVVHCNTRSYTYLLIEARIIFRSFEKKEVN
jgi:hypothetical protein